MDSLFREIWWEFSVFCFVVSLSFFDLWNCVCNKTWKTLGHYFSRYFFYFILSSFGISTTYMLDCLMSSNSWMFCPFLHYFALCVLVLIDWNISIDLLLSLQILSCTLWVDESLMAFFTSITILFLAFLFNSYSFHFFADITWVVHFSPFT